MTIPDPSTRALYALPQSASDELRKHVEATEKERIRLVNAERLYAVLIIGAGTLLNGYGPTVIRLAARLFGLEITPS